LAARISFNGAVDFDGEIGNNAADVKSDGNADNTGVSSEKRDPAFWRNWQTQWIQNPSPVRA